MDGIGKLRAKGEDSRVGIRKERKQLSRGDYSWSNIEFPKASIPSIPVTKRDSNISGESLLWP